MQRIGHLHERDHHIRRDVAILQSRVVLMSTGAKGGMSEKKKPPSFVKSNRVTLMSVCSQAQARTRANQSYQKIAEMCNRKHAGNVGERVTTQTRAVPQLMSRSSAETVSRNSSDKAVSTQGPI